MQNKVMAIVERICNIESISCRGLDQSGFARELMDLANIPQNADIQEIPLDWNNQVVILFLMPNDKNYYSLFAGIGNNGKFYFELSITGILEGEYFHFFQEDDKEEIVLPIDYFVSKTTITEEIKDFIEITAKKAVNEYPEPEMTIEQYISEYMSQIKEYDYYNVVNWANWKGIQVPEKLSWIIDPEF